MTVADLVGRSDAARTTDGRARRGVAVVPKIMMRRACLLLLLLEMCAGLKPPPFVPRRLYLDWVALNSKTTTRHLMRPPTPAGRDECIALKAQILAAQNAGEFVVDAFSAFAIANSTDETTRAAGGLLGTRLRQGVCRVPELDRAGFVAPLGRVSGPVQSSEGFHLVLVEERIGLTMHRARGD